MKKAEELSESLKKEVVELRDDRESTQRYAELIEQRFKERARAEELANRKVLSLLDDVQRLTAENNRLLGPSSTVTETVESALQLGVQVLGTAES